MRNTRFQNKVATRGSSFPIVIIITTLIWYVSILLTGDYKAVYSPFIENILEMVWPNGNVWVEGGIGLLFSVLTAYTILELHNTFSLIRIRSTMVGVVFLWCMGCCSFLHVMQPGIFLQLCFVALLFSLFASYQQIEPVKQICFAFFFCGLGSLFSPKFIYLVPLLLLGMIQFQSFTIRTFFAGVIGLVIPYSFWAVFLLYSQNFDLMTNQLTEWTSFSPIDYSLLSIDQIAAFCLLTLITIFSAGHFMANSFQDKIRIRSYFSFLFIADLAVGTSIILQPSMFNELFSVYLVINSITGAHLFALTNSKVTNLFFIVCIVLSILIAIVPIWMPFINF